MKVLIVEDDCAVRELMKRVVGDLVDSFASAATAGMPWQLTKRIAQGA
jgi:hypothetical protein